MNPTLESPPSAKPAHTCPVWIGHLLANPLRRLLENPRHLVLPLVKAGHRVLELGPALGFFTLPVAEAVGEQGKVVCVEVQEGMLRGLRKRLDKRGLLARTELRRCTHEDLGLAELVETCDLVLALHVVHETISPGQTMADLARCVKPGGLLLLVEPPGHCSPAAFRAAIAGAEGAGLVRTPHPCAEGRRNLVLLQRPRGATS
ncbi:MAG: class I SAM-dependent methyltransferase [Deltaproteobacteria bacterium]|nr:class I SAM-dependent methyltransferase [Deltaproteobacteria bacterium]